MTITEFARSREILTQTVSTYIRRHFGEFKGHTRKTGKTVELDETALSLLDKQYPLPRPVEIVHDYETQEELIATQKLVIKLQARLAEQSALVAQAEAQKLLLEDKQTELAELKDKYEKLQEEYDKEIRKTWWDKLLRK